MPKKLINKSCPQGTTTTGIINGVSSGIIDLNNIRYQWAYDLWEIMLNNTWFSKEVDISNEAKKYKELNESEKFLYDSALAQLIFMDSLQTNNTVDNVNPWVTAPEVNMVLIRQSFEEALHSQSYAVLTDSVSTNSAEIYEKWRTDNNLEDKNDFILHIYEKYAPLCEQGDTVAKIYMIVANQCLEGIYFYSGFAALYALARAGKMIGSAQMIRFIQRDEITHLQLFANIFKEIKKEFPEAFTQEVIDTIYKMFDSAAKQEIKWGKHMIKGGILGLTDTIIEDFVQELVNDRLFAIGMKGLYEPKEKEAIPWFNDFSKINNLKTNFFEGNNAAYSKGSLDLNDF